MTNKEMPDDIYIQWRDRTNEAEHEFRGNSFRVSDTDKKYHADHIVQRLEREKAELADIIRYAQTKLTMLGGVEYAIVMNDLLQKHKDTK